jgi:hypothetical protein
MKKSERLAKKIHRKAVAAHVLTEVIWLILATLFFKYFL